MVAGFLCFYTLQQKIVSRRKIYKVRFFYTVHGIKFSSPFGHRILKGRGENKYVVLWHWLETITGEKCYGRYHVWETMRHSKAIADGIWWRVCARLLQPFLLETWNFLMPTLSHFWRQFPSVKLTNKSFSRQMVARWNISDWWQETEFYPWRKVSAIQSVTLYM